MSEVQTDRQIAVFLDVENLAIHAAQQGLTFRVQPIVDRAKSEGRVTVARAYGDFSKPFMRDVLKDLMSSVFELGQLPTDIKGKNTADMLLALDALEMYLRPARPDVVVIGSGDRDYVPLVQRLRRYGAHVIGVGLKGSISVMLRTICDDYWYYDDLAPSLPSQADIAQPPADSLEAALALFHSVVVELEAMEEPVQLSRVKEIMCQRRSGFKVQDFGFSSFKDFAQTAAERGLVRIKSAGATTLTVTARVDAAEPAEESPDARAQRLADQYRAVLTDKRVPLVPWDARMRLIEALWQELQAAEDGLTIADMSNAIKLAALRLGISVSDQAVYKMTYTLNLGRCFATDGGPTFVDDIFNMKVRAACDAAEALNRMNMTYLRGIHMDRPDLPLEGPAVARLVFGDATPEHVETATTYISKVRNWVYY